MRDPSWKSRPDGPAPLEIVIRSDGRVAFRTFTEEMMNLALTLAPDEPTLLARAHTRDRAREGGTDEAGSDS